MPDEDNQKQFARRHRPANQWEHKSSLLPYSEEYKSKTYAPLINRHLPLASIKDDQLLLILEKEKSLVEAQFHRLAERDKNLQPLAEWISHTLEVQSLLTRAKDGGERKLQATNDIGQFPKI